MLDFEEELKKFRPSPEIDQVEDNVYKNNLADVTDLLDEMLKEIKNLQLALYGIDEDGEHHEDERIVFIEDEYPTVLLDMIYAKYKEAK